MTIKTLTYRRIKIICYFDKIGMTAWSVKFNGQWYGASGEFGLLQYAENAVDSLKLGRKPAGWSWRP